MQFASSEQRLSKTKFSNAQKRIPATTQIDHPQSPIRIWEQKRGSEDYIGNPHDRAQSRAVNNKHIDVHEHMFF